MKFLAGLGKGKRFLVLFGVGLLAIIMANIIGADSLGQTVYNLVNVVGAILIVLGVVGLIVKIMTGIASGVKKVSDKIFGGNKKVKQYGNYSSSVNEDSKNITLVFGNGTEVTFKKLDSFYWAGNRYAVMAIAKPFGTMKIGDKVVFRVYKDSNNVDKYTLDIPDDTLNAVFNEYKRRNA